MATERKVIGQAQRILVDATNNIWHRISTWTHASDVEMPNGDPLNEFLTDMNDNINESLDGKYNSYNMVTTGIGSLDQIPEVGYSRVQTLVPITAGDYTIPANHYCYCYSGKDPNSIEKMAVMIDTTDLTDIIMYIAHYSIEARWTLTKIATQKQIDDLQNQIDELNVSFNQLNLYVDSSIGYLNARYQIIQDQMDWLEAELEDLQEQLNDLLNELRDFKVEVKSKFDALYGLYKPIGSIYLTTSVTINGRLTYEYLEDVFGGKWALVQDAYLYAGHFAGHDGVPDDYDGNSAMVRPPGEDNYVRMRGWKAVFDGDASVPTDRMARDYSQIYQGRTSVVLDKANLPRHSHKVSDAAEHGRVVAPYYQLYGDYHNYQAGGVGWSDMSFTPSEESAPYFVTAFNKRNIKTVGPDANTLGKSYVEPDVGSNEYPGEDLFRPIELNPIRFKVYVWCRVA